MISRHNTEVQCFRLTLNKGGLNEKTSVEQAELLVMLLIVCLTKPDEDLCEIETLLH